jgi:hypothetical protein
MLYKMKLFYKLKDCFVPRNDKRIRHYEEVRRSNLNIRTHNKQIASCLAMTTHTRHYKEERGNKKTLYQRV